MDLFGNRRLRTPTTLPTKVFRTSMRLHERWYAMRFPTQARRAHRSLRLVAGTFTIATRTELREYPVIPNSMKSPNHAVQRTRIS